MMMTTNLNKPEESHENVQEEKTTEIIESKETPKEKQANMVTIDRTKAENFLMILAESTKDIEELREVTDKLIADKRFALDSFQNTTLEKFNALIDSTKELSKKINATESYENYLQEQIKNADMTKQNRMLDQQLQKERAEQSSFRINVENILKNLNDLLTSELDNMRKRVDDLKVENEIIENHLSKYTESLETVYQQYSEKYENSVRDIKALFDTKLEEASDSLLNGTTVQQNNLKAKANDLIKEFTEKCQKDIEIIKNQSLDFLKQCQEQNKKLIEKVPEVKSKKITKKDLIYYLVAAICIASFIAQVIF